MPAPIPFDAPVANAIFPSSFPILLASRFHAGRTTAYERQIALRYAFVTVTGAVSASW